MGNKKTANKCHKCKKKVEGLPFKCAYCGNTNCSKHHLPENHNCEYLDGKNDRNLEDWKNKIRGLKKDYHRDDEYFGDNSFNVQEYLEPLEINPFKKSKQIKSSDSGGNGFIIFLVIILAVVCYFSYYPIDTEDTDDDIYPSTYGYNSVSINELPITYQISESCGSSQSNRIIKAFNILSEESSYSVFFILTNSDPDIDIKCHLEVMEEGNYYTSGQATMGTIGYSVYGSEIDFYNVNPIANNRFPGGCLTYPNTELHEILHTFGFDHNESRDSIMTSISNGCVVRSIDNYIIESLQDTYS